LDDRISEALPFGQRTRNYGGRFDSRYFFRGPEGKKKTSFPGGHRGSGPWGQRVKLGAPGGGRGDDFSAGVWGARNQAPGKACRPIFFLPKTKFPAEWLRLARFRWANFWPDNFARIVSTWPAWAGGPLCPGPQQLLGPFEKKNPLLREIWEGHQTGLLGYAGRGQRGHLLGPPPPPPNSVTTDLDFGLAGSPKTKRFAHLRDFLRIHGRRMAGFDAGKRQKTRP